MSMKPVIFMLDASVVRGIRASNDASRHMFPRSRAGGAGTRHGWARRGTLRSSSWDAPRRGPGKPDVAAATRRAKHFGLPEITHDVQPHSQKYFSFRKSETDVYPHRPASTRGRFGRSSPDVRRDAMDA